MSEIYVSEADRARERAVGELMTATWGCDVHQLPRLCILDFYMHARGQMLAVGELKCHTRAHPRIMVAAGKYAALILAGAAFRVPALLLIRQPDASVWWMTADTQSVHHLAMMKRPDRGGYELCVFVDSWRFQRLGVAADA